MVDLPTVTPGLVTSRQPTSAVSEVDIASPYKQLANNLTKAGEVAQDVSVKLATQAGADAVSEDGKTITKPDIPILGPASAEFARAARFTALSRLTPQIEDKMAEIRIAHPNDPQAFRAAADAYTKQITEQQPDPILRGAVEKTSLNQASSNYRQSLAQTEATNVQNGKVSITSQISDLSNKMATAAFNGGVDSPDYKQWQASVGALYSELGNDARMGYPKARIESELSELTSQHKTMAIAGQAVRMMDSDSPTGRADAKKWLMDKIYNDQSLNLSLTQRHQAVTTAMGLMEARSAEGKALIDANKATTQTLLTQLNTNVPYNPIQVNDAIEGARKLGDAESFYRLTFAKGMHDWDQTVRSLPLPQQMSALRQLDASHINKTAASDAMTFFTGRGYTKEQASGIVGNLIQESNLDPNTVHDNGTGLGIAGHRLERLDAMKKFADGKGKPVNDFQTQLEFIDHELQTTESGTGAALKAARTSQEAARAFINYERPQGWTAANPEGGNGYANRVANAQAVAGSGGAGAAWFDQARLEQIGRTRDYLKTQATEYVGTAEKMINKTGDISDDMLRNISDVLKETGQDDLRKRMDVALMAHYGVKELDKLPENVRQSWVAQSNAQARDGVVAFQVHEHMADTIKANAAAMKDTPYSTFAVRTGGNPPAAYNFSDPGNVQAVASNRAAVQKQIRNNDGTGPTSVFEGKEGEGFANTLTNGDPAVAAQSLGGLASLPPDVYAATLGSKPVAEAVTGMMSSRDPARMTAGMSAVDKVWRDDPAGAQSSFGPAAITKLQAWQALRGSFGSAELAERLNMSDDPSTRAARQEAKDAAEKETSSFTPSDMAYKMGTGWAVTGRVTGSTPSAPFDSIKGGELVADYRSTYSALRSFGVDADKASSLAVDRLKSTWGVSESAGNQLMKNPPERSYPAIDGSQSWIGQDLKKWVEGKAGPEMSNNSRSLEMGIGGAGQDRNWKIEGLISDGQTAAEVGSGRLPSYQVAIRKNDGTLDIIPSRIAFDPKEHVAEHEAKLNQRRQAVDFLRVGQFQSNMPQP